MSAPEFYDGVFTEANRTNEASGRSFHIPDEEREPTNAVIFLAVMAVMIVGLSAIASLAAVM